MSYGAYGRLKINDGPVNPTIYVVSDTDPIVPLFDDTVLSAVAANQRLVVDHITVLNANGASADRVVILERRSGSPAGPTVMSWGAPDDHISRSYNGLFYGEAGEMLQFTTDSALGGGEFITLAVTWHADTVG